MAETRILSRLEIIRFAQLIDEKMTSKIISQSTGIPEKILNSYYQKLRKESFKILEPDKLDLIIDTLAISRKLNIVQIGANDGKTSDPIYKKNLQYGNKLLLIEPQIQFREDLLRNYSDFKGELHIEHVAIGNSKERLKFHILKKEYWEEYKSKVGKLPDHAFSLIKNQVEIIMAERLGIDISKIDEYMTTLDIDILPLQNLLKKYNFGDIDILQIDAEGYDFQIINSLEDIKPKIIHFESAFLSKNDWNLFKDFCEEKGYGFIQGIQDTLAIYGSNERYELYKIGDDNKYRFPIKVRKNVAN